MTKKERNSNHQKTIKSLSIEELRREIYSELRVIVKQKFDLLMPKLYFQKIENRKEDEPKFRVVFDNKPFPSFMKGLRIPTKKIKLADEKIVNDILNFAQNVWHLKDKLKIWAKMSQCNIDMDREANSNIALLVCADLANRKKHGRHENRSGVDPRLEKEVEFDTSQSGIIELSYRYDSQEKELLVSNQIPIPYKVQILRENGEVLADNAVNYISSGFNTWLPVIENLQIIKNDEEGKALRLMLYLNKL